jgi:beta-N-acetylhexosaminidase
MEFPIQLVQPLKNAPWGFAINLTGLKVKLPLFVFKYKVNSGMLKKVLLVVLLSGLFPLWNAANGQSLQNDAGRSRWVDSVFNTLSRDEKIGQMFMVPVSAYANEDQIEKLVSSVEDGDVGFLYITGGGPIGYKRLLERVKKVSKVPLLVAASAEWGLAQTLDSVTGFHKPMISTVWKDDSLSYKWARTIARQMKQFDVHINFGPNISHEIFRGDFLRYFGNDPSVVAHHSVQFAKAMQDEGILSVAKALPRIPSQVSPVLDTASVIDLSKLDFNGLYVLKKIIESNVSGIYTSNLPFSMQQMNGIFPAAVSRIFVSEILKRKLDFKGLVFTDVKNFAKVTAKVRVGDAELLAFETGTDVLMSPLNVNAARRKINKRIKKDVVLQQQLEVTVKTILGAKYDAGLHHVSREEKIPAAGTSIASLDLLRHRLAEATTTLVKNDSSFLPIKTIDHQSFLSVSIGRDNDNEFNRYLKKYAPFKTISIKTPQDTAYSFWKPGDIIVLSIYPHMQKLEFEVNAWLRRLTMQKNVVVVSFSDPLALPQYEHATSIIAAYTDDDYMSEVVPQMIFGALKAPGRLPISAGRFKSNQSLDTPLEDRLSYTMPEEAHLDKAVLEKISVIMKEAIDIGATPGAHVIVAKDGKVVFDRSMGSLDYTNATPVTDDTIYDLASLTKVSATLQAVMYMYEKGLIDINKKASVYLPELKNTNKKDITIIDMLTHQSGLVPFVPLWNQTVIDSTFIPLYYSRTQSPEYPLQVAPELFASNIIRDSVWAWVVKSKMQDKPPRTPFPYRYSDLGFMMFKQMAERILQKPLDEFVQQNFYGPLGAYTTGFNPLKRFPIDNIAPTEIDKIYRKEMVVGTVHDERAAMMGGVSGHAGLFSTANDLAKLGQMLLQEGHYGGVTFFKPETIKLFTSKQFEESRRGLGWDKPVQNDWSSPTALQVSPLTFGHTGFTGTCLWVDPKFGIVYVFLSNRVFPDRNNKLLNANIRSRIQEVIYQAMFAYCSNKN